MAALGLLDPAGLQSRYETLRMAALGEPLPPECRRGLALFLRRGMWGWSQRASCEAPSEPRSPIASSAWAVPYQPRAIVHAFAAMAMARNPGEAR
jgi:hypothetical protein